MDSENRLCESRACESRCVFLFITLHALGSYPLTPHVYLSLEPTSLPNGISSVKGRELVVHELDLVVELLVLHVVLVLVLEELALRLHRLRGFG